MSIYLGNPKLSHLLYLWMCSSCFLIAPAIIAARWTMDVFGEEHNTAAFDHYCCSMDAVEGVQITASIGKRA